VKAAVHTRYGLPDAVRISQVAKPTAGDNELLVKVHATTVNRTDCRYRAGPPWIMHPHLSGPVRSRVNVQGNEFAGQVVAAGRGVSSFRVGDRVCRPLVTGGASLGRWGAGLWQATVS
jgi:NADPH:quinone reductase-like Zn-dependent oxidoreductase